MNDPSVELDCPLDHDYCNSTEPAALDMSLDHNEELSVEIARLRNQIEEITISRKFCLEWFAGSDDDIRFFTRFFNPLTHFFLFMNYLSLGLMQKDLDHRFKIHQSTVSRIINTWANFLSTVLGAVGIWANFLYTVLGAVGIWANFLSTVLGAVGIWANFLSTVLGAVGAVGIWANFLSTVLGAVGIWLGEETVKSHMPEVFQGYSTPKYAAKHLVLFSSTSPE
ncbi:unnamed protein product [Coregonus sp. 'balchen']|nr:unnamed protein product [Coregonus sp. 'balchen']